MKRDGSMSTSSPPRSRAMTGKTRYNSCFARVSRKNRGVYQQASEMVATNHGSMQRYDRLVPVLLLPPGRALHAALTAPDPAPFSMTRVATILARWLGVTPPSALR